MLYRGVRAVNRAPDGSLSLDGWGRAVDWLVEMARFDQDMQLDRLATRGALDLGLMPRLADAVAHFHDLAERRGDQGGLEGMAAVLRGNRNELPERGRGVLDATACRRLAADSFEMLDRHTHVLEARRMAGFVRHCHGDLHLRNICLIDGAPTLFDCVEFNPAITCVDVAYDLAFLLMDLLHRGLDRHANEVLNRYVERTGDIGGMALLPLFLSARAAVRAKTSATALSLTRHLDEAAGLRTEARRYLELAQELGTPHAPQLIAVGGPSGSGKTTLARRLASSIGPAPGALIVRSDVERKRLLGVSAQIRLGPEGYAAGVTRDVYRRLAERAGAILDGGHGVIIDAVCGDPLARTTFAEVADANHVPFTGLWLQAPLDALTTRLRARVDDASDATTDVAARQVERLNAPESWTRLDASGDVETVWRAARRVTGRAGR